MPVETPSVCMSLNPDEFISRVRELSSLPDSAMHVVEVVSDDSADAGDLQKVIGQDPSLTAKLLKLVNSSYYGFSDRVADIRRAIVILGFNAVRNLALSVSVCEMFRAGDQIGSYSRGGLWQHSVGAGIAAKMICRRMALPFSEESFTAGILHDVGMILEDQYAHDSFLRVQRASQDTHRPLHQVEREMLETDHAEIGYRLCVHWKFPEAICWAIRYHHGSPPDGDVGDLARVLQVADFLAFVKNIGAGAHVEIAPEVSAFKELGLSRLDVLVILEDLDENVRKASEFLML